jgi:hypothetical protein
LARHHTHRIRQDNTQTFTADTFVDAGNDAVYRATKDRKRASEVGEGRGGGGQERRANQHVCAAQYSSVAKSEYNHTICSELGCTTLPSPEGIDWTRAASAARRRMATTPRWLVPAQCLTPLKSRRSPPPPRPLYGALCRVGGDRRDCQRRRYLPDGALDRPPGCGTLHAGGPPQRDNTYTYSNSVSTLLSTPAAGGSAASSAAAAVPTISATATSGSRQAQR